MDCNNVPDTGHAALALEHLSVCLMCKLWNRHCWPQDRAPGKKCDGCKTNALLCITPEFAVLLFGDVASSLLGINPVCLPEGPIHYEGPEGANSRLAELILRQVATLACAMPFPCALAGSDQLDLDPANSDNGGEIALGGTVVSCLDDETMSTSTTTSQPDWEVLGGYADAPMPENTVAGRNTFTQPSGAHVGPGTYWNTVVTISFSPSPQRYFSVPDARGADFIPREGILNRILQSFSLVSNSNGENVIFLEGLPGSGKTTMALNVAFEVRERYPDHSVFWLSATSLSDLQGSYRRIASVLGIKLYQDISTEHLQVTQALEQHHKARWLWIIDTEPDICPDGVVPLWQYLPRIRNGTILITGRSSQAAASLGARPENIINVSRMSDDEAVKLWRQTMVDGIEYGPGSTLEMIRLLGHSPLAIKKTCSYIRMSWSRAAEAMRVKKVVTQPQRVNATISLSDEFDPLFRLIKRKDSFGWDALCFMCYLDAAPLPLSLLPEPPRGVDIYQALQRLKEHSLILQGEEGPSSSIRIDPIVQLSLRVWLKNEKEHLQVIDTTMVKLAIRLPPPTTSTWEEYFPHLWAVLRFAHLSELSAEVVIRCKFGLGLWAMDRLDEAEMQLRICIMLSELVDGQRPIGLMLCTEILMLFLKDESRHKEAEFYRQGAHELNFYLAPSFSLNLQFQYNCLDLAVQRLHILEKVHMYPCIEAIL